MFAHLSSSPRTLPFVPRVRVRKTVQRRVMTLKRRKQPIRTRGMPAIGTFAKLILRTSKTVNIRHSVATCDRTKPLRDAWTQRALPDQDGKKFSCGRMTKPRTGKPNHPLACSTAWWISQRRGNSEASFGRHRRRARRRADNPTASHSSSLASSMHLDGLSFAR